MEESVLLHHSNKDDTNYIGINRALIEHSAFLVILADSQALECLACGGQIWPSSKLNYWYTMNAWPLALSLVYIHGQ